MGKMKRREREELKPNGKTVERRIGQEYDTELAKIMQRGKGDDR